MAKVLTQLLDEQQKRLIDCERQLEESLEGGSAALKKIHDEKLYKAEGYATFEVYAEQRWGWSKSYAYRLIDYSQIVKRLKEEGKFSSFSEGTLRPVMKLKRTSKDGEDFINRAVNMIEIATDTAPKKFDVPKVTAQHLESTMQHMGVSGRRPKPKTDPAVDELKAICQKIRHSDLYKVGDADKWIKKHGMDGFPDDFHDIADLFNDCAALLVR